MFFLKDLPTREILDAYKRRFPTMDVPAVNNALRLLRSASVLLRDLEQYFAAQGFSQTRFLICILLDREPGGSGLQACALADKLDVSKPVVSKTLAALQAEGLVQAAPHNEVKRAKQLTLTPEGRKRLYALLPGYYVILERHMAHDDGAGRAE